MEIKVNKAYVFDTVDETAAYIGAKAVGDEGAYERIFTTDADRVLLENFWSEASELATQQLKSFISQVSDNTVSHSVNLSQNYEVTLKTPSNYDSSLDNSINSSLFHFFVYFIVSKWCRLTSKTDAESYAIDATSMLNDAVRKLYHRKRPQRPTNNEE
jgi:hypothetical protein